MNDLIDHIMAVMDTAFDPQYGEAWTRRQVSDALLMGNCHALVADTAGAITAHPETAAGFALSRNTGDEEELLLVAVHPDWRGLGIAGALLTRALADADARGARRMFLEMREGNPAEALYRRHGFEQIGRRPNYYKRGSARGLDALTFVRSL